MMSNEIKNKIDYVLDEFDFEKCQKCMKALNWIWSSSLTLDGIPTIGEMRRFARALLIESYKNKNEISSGGFIATYREESTDNPEYFLLQFVVAYRYSDDNL